MKIKKLIGKIHLWLGLTAGLIVVFLGITGCILSFQREIENTFQRYRYVTERNKEVLPPSSLEAIAKHLLPGKKLHAIMYNGKRLAAQAIFYQYEPENYYYLIYLDPYDGRVLKVKNMNCDFFRVVLDGHFYLWLPPAIGQPIVASATLAFLIMMITGLVLWWPRNKAATKQRFTVKWSARWRRKNYDLHNVLGFYMTWVAIFLAITGLVWGFQWFAKGLYTVTGGNKSLVYAEPSSDTLRSNIVRDTAAIDIIWKKMVDLYPSAESIEVHPPENAASPIAANANPDRDTYWKIDYRYFDQYTLEELNVDHIYGRFSSSDGADKAMRMNYDVHTGAILGITGKVMMFFGSLIAASLPVTGFLIWMGRRKKRKVAAFKSAQRPNIPDKTKTISAPVSS
jgi:uncharacterized iron-regulated membrane protein